MASVVILKILYGMVFFACEFQGKWKWNTGVRGEFRTCRYLAQSWKTLQWLLSSVFSRGTRTGRRLNAAVSRSIIISRRCNERLVSHTQENLLVIDDDHG